MSDQSINGNVLGLCQVDGFCPWKLFNLNESSFVVDLGAYRGDFSKYILDTYNCRVDAYEPSDMDNVINHPKFRWIQKVVFDGRKVFFEKNQGTGGNIFEYGREITGDEMQSVDIKEITKEHIDLMKVNIEGAEMVVLKRANLKNVEQLLVEFHLFRGERKGIGITKEKIDKLVKRIMSFGYKSHKINDAPAYMFYG